MSQPMTALRGGFLTLLTLFGGLLIGLVAGDITFRLIPGSSVENVKVKVHRTRLKLKKILQRGDES